MADPTERLVAALGDRWALSSFQVPEEGVRSQTPPLVVTYFHSVLRRLVEEPPPWRSGLGIQLQRLQVLQRHRFNPGPARGVREPRDPALPRVWLGFHRGPKNWHNRGCGCKQ